jgi:nucleoside phosphorylase
VKCIAIVIAMSSEAEPILRVLNAQEILAVPLLPFKFYEAHRSECRIIISVNGVDKHHGVDAIGTESAALNTYCVIDRFKPDVVISAGTAGGWSARGAMIGDVYLSDQKFVHHDRRIGIAGFLEYGIGSYPAVPVSALARALNVKQGIVTTSNSLDENDDDRRLIAESGGSVKEMEAAAVAYVCEMMSTPVMAVKAITDLVDHPMATAEQFNANLSMASRQLGENLLKIVDFCAPRSVRDLEG